MSVGFGNARRPMAPTLPLIEKDFGTSRWQLAIESYTNFARSWKGRGFRNWPDPVEPCVGRRVR
jgi:hypothetical protein